MTSKMLYNFYNSHNSLTWLQNILKYKSFEHQWNMLGSQLVSSMMFQ